MINSIRLTEKEKKALEESFEKVLAPIGNFEVFLFGSRTDINKKGGDIDLFVFCAAPLDKAKMTLTRQLKINIYDRIGEQKIDIVWDDNSSKEETFNEIIGSAKVLLWKTRN